MTRVLLVGLGGFAGSVLRYLVSGLVHGANRFAGFPAGTLVVNVSGCFLIGVASYVAEERGALSAEARLFLLTGILGGFTTFSAFGNETMALLRDGEALQATGNVVASVVLGLAAVWLGRAAAFGIWR